MSYNNILSSLSEIFNNSFVLKKYNVAILSEEPKAIRPTESTAASAASWNEVLRFYSVSEAHR